MDDKDGIGKMALDRRDFFKAAGVGLTAAGAMLTAQKEGQAQQASFSEVQVQAPNEKFNLERLAANSYGVRDLFKRRSYPRRKQGERPSNPVPADLANNPNAAEAIAEAREAANARAKLPTPEEQKAKYGEITILDFPQFVKNTFHGVTHLDMSSWFFGDFDDESMYFPAGTTIGGFNPRSSFDPLSPAGRKWLDKLASNCVKNGTKVQHISNDSPINLAAFGSSENNELRLAGVAIGKRWIEGLSKAGVGMKSMRMNSPSSLGPSIRPSAVPHGPGDGYPRDIDIVPQLAAAIESYKEMADFGGNYNVRVTLENHWGLAADPMMIRTIVDEVNHPYCEASPDMCNWEQKYMLFNGLKALAPYAHTNVHAKYWDRWDTNDIQRSTRILLAHGYKGTFAAEYERGPWDQVEGCRYVMKEVMAALAMPTAG
ncbi:MAG TPA: TIM barrel protein [Bryobacteraceae bacterium]|jgi:sugar phosphate isomerase/epimerase